MIHQFITGVSSRRSCHKVPRPTHTPIITGRIRINMRADINQIFVRYFLYATDISSIIQTFNRYNYTIKASYMESDELEDLLHNRYEAFMKFLNI